MDYGVFEITILMQRKIIIDGHAYPNFKDEFNNVFFWPEQQLFDHNGHHGGRLGGILLQTITHICAILITLQLKNTLVCCST